MEVNSIKELEEISMILETVSTEHGTLKCKETPNSNPLQGNSDELTLSVDE